MIQAIPEKSKPKAITLLRFLAFSDKQLTVNELVDALAVNVDDIRKFVPALRMPDPTEICLYCPSLVSFSLGTQVEKTDAGRAC